MENSQPLFASGSTPASAVDSLLNAAKTRRLEEAEAERAAAEQSRRLDEQKALRSRLAEALERAYRFTNEETEQGRKPSPDGFQRWAERFRGVGTVIQESERAIERLRLRDRLRTVADRKAPSALKFACAILLQSCDEVDTHPLASALENAHQDRELRRFVLWLPFIRDQLWHPFRDGDGPVAYAEPPDGTSYAEMLEANTAFGWTTVALPHGFEALNKVGRDGLGASALEEWSERWQDLGKRYPDPETYAGMPPKELGAEEVAMRGELEQLARSKGWIQEPARLAGVEAIRDRMKTLRIVWEQFNSGSHRVDYAKDIDELRQFWHQEHRAGQIANAPPRLHSTPTTMAQALDVFNDFDAKLTESEPTQPAPMCLHIDDIDTFDKVRELPQGAAEKLLGKQGYLDKSEEEIQTALEVIIGESVHKEDWGGEINDLYTTNIRIKGARVRAAFLLKGNGLKKKTMKIAHCGKNGDQLVRLMESPAELFVVQFVGNIDENVIRDLEGKVELARRRGKQASYCVINGQDTARLLVAYGKA